MRPLAPGNPLPLCARRRARRGDAARSARRSSRATSPRPSWRMIGDELADGIDLGRAGEADAAVAVRRAAHRLQPRPAGALHRHRARAFPALHPVHQLPPLCRRIRRLGRASSSARAATPRWPARAGCCSTHATENARAQLSRHRLAAAPDARLSPDGARPQRASPWSTSASGPPTPRRSPTTSRCCGPRPG